MVRGAAVVLRLRAGATAFAALAVVLAALAAVFLTTFFAFAIGFSFPIASINVFNTVPIMGVVISVSLLMFMTFFG
jgi:hypothetical protein